MARYQVVLAYDGTGFSGFQRQKSGSGKRTVQAEVESALRRLGWQGGSVLSAGRTDGGVHASGQVIAFDLDWRQPPEALQSALNANLPVDMVVRSARPVPAEFHPRFDAVQRRYRYRLFNQPLRDPFRERYAWRIWPEADPEKLHAGAAELIGTHDFAAFGSPPKRGGATVRTVHRAEWLSEPPDGWVFEIAANAFLFHMVRRLTAFLVAIGQGWIDLGAVRSSLLHPGEARVQTLAPPNGLTLVEVVYPDELPGKRDENNLESN